MRLSILAMIAAIGLGGASAARADEATVNVTNRTEQSIVALYATPKGETTVSEANLLQAGAIAAAGTGEIVIGAEDALCVYDLNIDFADGARIGRPDVDLCYTDELIVD